MKETTKEVFDFIAKAQQTRYKFFKKYKIDRWVIITFMLFIFAHLSFVAWHYHFNLDYYYCGGSSMGTTIVDSCENPFYNEETAWKGQEYLPIGEYGFKPTALFKSVYYMPVVFMALAFILNHFLHNRKFKFSEVENDKPGD